MGMLGRIFGGGLGWALGGPIGGLIGWYLGSRVDDAQDAQPQFRTRASSAATRPGDFAVALLVLIAKVLKADGRVVKAELDYVKAFLVRSFGRENAQEMLLLLRNLLDQDYYIYEVAAQINRHMNSAEKLELLHLLFGISQADKAISPEELDVIEEIVRHLSIPRRDYESIKAIFVKDSKGSYTILEIDSDVTDQEVKRAYRSMAAKYHPDKVQHLGPDFQKVAEEKFKAINEAYQEIKAQRGM